jgi:iron(III) transport system permease protein
VTALEAVLRPARLLGSGALGRNVALGLLLVLLLFLTAYPMAMLVYGSLSTAPPGETGAWSFAGWRAMFSYTNGVVLTTRPY